MSFTIFQNQKTPFNAIKRGSLKSQKIDIFPKWLTHGFGPKMAIFRWFWFKNENFSKFFFSGNIGKQNVFYGILEREKRHSRL